MRKVDIVKNFKVVSFFLCFLVFTTQGKTLSYKQKSLGWRSYTEICIGGLKRGAITEVLVVAGASLLCLIGRINLSKSEWVSESEDPDVYLDNYYVYDTLGFLCGFYGTCIITPGAFVSGVFNRYNNTFETCYNNAVRLLSSINMQDCNLSDRSLFLEKIERVEQQLKRAIESRSWIESKDREKTELLLAELAKITNELTS